MLHKIHHDRLSCATGGCESSQRLRFSDSSCHSSPKGTWLCQHRQKLQRPATPSAVESAAEASRTTETLAQVTERLNETSRYSDGQIALPSSGWQTLPHHLHAEALWQAIREEARNDAEMEPALASFVHTAILTHGSLAKSMAFMLANKLSSRTLLGTQLMRLIMAAYEDDPGIMEACRADVQAVRERDAACDKFLHCILYYKGFQAVQCHRIAHWLWQQGRQTLAVAIQSRVSEVMQVDIHPAAQIGRGIMIDHATGVVIGETAVVGDNVSLLHHVTLGGSGTGRGRRHPTLGHGVLLGAGVCVLGPITIGAGSKVGAGSVVVTELPCHCVAVGVPARIIKQNCTHEPCTDMDLVEDFILDYQI